MPVLLSRLLLLPPPLLLQPPRPKASSSCCPKNLVRRCVAWLTPVSDVTHFTVLLLLFNGLFMHARIHVILILFFLQHTGTFQFQIPGRAIMGLRHFNLLQPPKNKKDPPTRIKVCGLAGVYRVVCLCVGWMGGLQVTGVSTFRLTCT